VINTSNNKTEDEGGNELGAGFNINETEREVRVAAMESILPNDSETS